ncbi:DnaJ domain-containing protein [Natronomonas sp. EA1]|uniref:DnaJ domain-containing protein n=1 Tax=Natronomonas sp. EA1 TaxID=3421655 RepID=UPI003EBCAB4C
MFHEVVAALPEWLLLGVLLGLVASVGAAALFYVGVRYFPEEPTPGEQIYDGDARRRREIREYLDAIGEQYAESHFVEGQEVAFYLPTRDVAITFDARAFFRIERSPTYAVLVEYEMPSVNLGYRLPFDVPELEDETEGDPAVSSFAVLGLPPSADEGAVKSAYRERVKEVHPDHGGSKEEFARVREAYTEAKKRAT